MNKKLQLSAAIVGVVLTTAIVASASNASFDDESVFRGFNKMQKHGQNQEVIDALNNNNYSQWLSAVGEDSKIAEVINTDNFSRFVKAHNLREESKELREEADGILEELGVERFGHKKMKGGFNREGYEAARTAIESGSYSEWLSAISEDSKILEIIDTEEKFNKLVEAHNLRVNGDYESAQEIRAELGFNTEREGVGKKMQRGMRGMDR